MTRNDAIRFVVKQLNRQDAVGERAVERALLALYERQTEDEKIRGQAQTRNGRGFNRFDSQFGTSLAERIRQGGRLTYKQLGVARKMVLKYRKQLAEETLATWAAREAALAAEEQAPPTLRSFEIAEQIERNRQGARQVLIAIEAA